MANGCVGHERSLCNHGDLAQHVSSYHQSAPWGGGGGGGGPRASPGALEHHDLELSPESRTDQASDSGRHCREPGQAVAVCSAWCTDAIVQREYSLWCADATSAVDRAKPHHLGEVAIETAHVLMQDMMVAPCRHRSARISWPDVSAGPPRPRLPPGQDRGCNLVTGSSGSGGGVVAGGSPAVPLAVAEIAACCTRLGRSASAEIDCRVRRRRPARIVDAVLCSCPHNAISKFWPSEWQANVAVEVAVARSGRAMTADRCDERRAGSLAVFARRHVGQVRKCS